MSPSRPRLAVHGHFYQPERRNPFTGEVTAQPEAAPYRDWNSRIDAECYKPNADRQNLAHISYDLGPTLAAWLATNDPTTMAGFVAQDLPTATTTTAATTAATIGRSTDASGRATTSPKTAAAAQPTASASAQPSSAADPPASGASRAVAVQPSVTSWAADSTTPAREWPPLRGHALAQAYHHTILPLASLADRRTEVRWGLRDFELRFGHRATGIWLPETAMDLPTLRVLADEGVQYTILAPWQAADSRLDSRRPYRVDLGSGRSIAVFFYDAALSSAASFDAGATMNADYFASNCVAPRLAGAAFPDGTAPLAIIATDGELYGHHQKFRDMFLARLVNPGPDAPARDFDVTTVGEVLAATPLTALPVAAVAERTSWSCLHGVLRWYAECPDAADGRWKGPLRVALERLAAAIDAISVRTAAAFIDPPAFWRARDRYVDVVFGTVDAEEFARRLLPEGSGRERDRQTLMSLLEAQRWRLAMFGSDGWFWGDPIRPETKQVLLCAARAVRLVDRVCDEHLEPRLREDLSLFVSPSRRIDGAAIYSEALEEAGQPG